MLDGLGLGDAVADAVWVTLGDVEREAGMVGVPVRVTVSETDAAGVCVTERDGDGEPVCEAEADALPEVDCDNVPVLV